MGGVCLVAGDGGGIAAAGAEGLAWPFCGGEGDTLAAPLGGPCASARSSPPTPGHAHARCWHGRLRAPRGSVRVSPDARHLPHHVQLLAGDCEARL